MTTIFVDPYLLVCPNIEDGKIAYSNYFESLVSWHDLTKCDWARVYTLQKTAELLFETEKYPLWQHLKDAIARFGIDYISVDSVTKIVNSLLQKLPGIESILEINEIKYEEESSVPIYHLENRDTKLLSSYYDLGALMLIYSRTSSDITAENVIFVTPGLVKHPVDVQFTFSMQQIKYNNNEHCNYSAKLPHKDSEQYSCYKDYASMEACCNIELKVCPLHPDEKKISLSGDHHGNNELSEFAEVLFKCPYVVEVICSLPYNSYAKKLVVKEYADGRIDITLWNTDAGYSMQIRTTGENIHETKAIGAIIEKQFG